MSVSPWGQGQDNAARCVRVNVGSDRVQRAGALVHAPTAVRKHGVDLAAADLEAA